MWFYELRTAKKRLVELRRGFDTEGEAKEAGERAKRMIEQVHIWHDGNEELNVITGALDEQ